MAKIEKNRWMFCQNLHKPVLEGHDIAYWKGQAFKNIKIGMEFEFNLPEQKGTCNGDNIGCICAEFKEENDCWKECIHKQSCFGRKTYDSCTNVAINCLPEDCSNCAHYSAICYGMSCIHFVSKCLVCTEYHTNCQECPIRIDPNSNPERIRQAARRVLNPSGTYGMICESGVHSITTDGSLLGGKGMEVITVGRRVDYWEYLKMAKNICSTAVNNGAYLNERCSIHMHMLLSYYDKLIENSESFGVPPRISELEKPLPEIIALNFHQLIRRYQNAITWMTMGLDNPDHMTRWEKFRVSVLPISGILNNMPNVIKAVSEHSGGNKYGFVNYKFIQFDNENDLKRFHIEIRVMDGILVPSVIAAVACMYYAMFVKAIEISRYGILEVGDSEWMEQANAIKNTILNNTKGYDAGDRFGDTKNVFKYKDILITESLDLVHQLKHILIKIGPAFQVLEQLAVKPIALRRCGGDNWEKIESDFEIPMTQDNILEVRLKEFIDLQMVKGCGSQSEWLNIVAEEIESSDTDKQYPENLFELLSDYIDKKKNDGEMIWSTTLGTVLTI